MQFLGYSGWQLLTQLPTLLVLAAGLVLALANRRLPRGPRGLLLAGLAVLLLGTLLSLGWLLALPRLVQSGGAAQFTRLSMIVGPLLALVHPLGLGLVVAAALTGRTTAPSPPAGPGHGWQPGAGGPVPQQWTGSNIPRADATAPDSSALDSSALAAPGPAGPSPAGPGPAAPGPDTPGSSSPS
ncbi:hypothetical protein MRQ36_07505 [Micromonospora sp. R77]|uniref:hypothetical protein n=1 Tax=Micromonospora sp. R77 TaxID=2925836 RepID=UPI001F60BE1C|nr:hypothetical protein [Micromonospora sp. R77]MCI4062416.1 hypothetical protein [Micromonospora sp. R77]